MLAVEAAASGRQERPPSRRARAFCPAPSRAAASAPVAKMRAVLGDVAKARCARWVPAKSPDARRPPCRRAGPRSRSRRPRARRYGRRARARIFVQRNVAAVRRRLAQQQCGARWRIDFQAVMHLHDLDIEIGQRLRRLLHQRGEQIDAQTHIAGFDDHGMARGGADFRFVVGANIPSCRSHGRCAPVPPARPARPKLRGLGEIDQRLRLGDQRQRIVGQRSRRERHRLPRSGWPWPSSAPHQREIIGSARPRRSSVRPMRPPAPAMTTRFCS